MTASAPPGTSNLLDSWFEGWAVALAGGADWWHAALTQPPRPLAVPRWVDVMSRRRPPAWTTPNEIVFDAPVARLRDFSRSGAPRARLATVVLPPQAGHDSCIVDYSEEQ